MFSSMSHLLEHIQEIEKEIIELSEKSTLVFGELIEKNSIEVDEQVTQVLQRQDMISQQLNATVDAIEEAKRSIQKCQVGIQNDAQSVQRELEELDRALQNILVNAKEKKEAYSGYFHSQNDNEIEFF